jgi:uncharacterized protein YjbJ (UPF0337 family)
MRGILTEGRSLPMRFAHMRLRMNDRRPYVVTTIAGSPGPTRASMPVQPEGLRNQFRMETAMNWDRVEGNWKQLKGAVKAQWGKITDDELDMIAGRRDQLAGKIQERYGIQKDEVERQLSEWESRQRDF